MAAVRWFLDWLAPLLIMTLGIVWFLSWAKVLPEQREQASLVFEDPWWLTIPACGAFVLLGALRLRMTLRRRRHSM